MCRIIFLSTKRDVFPRVKRRNFMLQSLKNTGNTANLPRQQYAEYVNELSILQHMWELDQKKLATGDFTLSIFTKAIDTRFIPQAVCQYDYDRVIYHCVDPKLGIGECRHLSEKEPYPVGLKSMADGGTIPCAMLSVLKYFQIDTSLLEIGSFLVKHGYRTKRHGTRWLAIDKVLEINYGIEAMIITSVLELASSLSLGYPVLALVPSMWLHKTLSHCPLRGHGNECIVIWKLQGSKALITATTVVDKPLLQIDLQDLLFHVLRAWYCKKR